MHIKSIKIEGFKSYARPVEVGPFDKAFNAITGLNGSGKSNILDSITFVLGSNDLKLARVSNLREFIYKSGQGGVVKAHVEIIFDNSDPNNRPNGYDNFSEITVTREVCYNVFLFRVFQVVIFLLYRSICKAGPSITSTASLSTHKRSTICSTPCN